MTNQTNQIRIVREHERKHITSISRTHAWELEKQGRFPKRLRLAGGRSVGWKLSELLDWLNEQPRV